MKSGQAFHTHRRIGSMKTVAGVRRKEEEIGEGKSQNR